MFHKEGKASIALATLLLLFSIVLVQYLNSYVLVEVLILGIALFTWIIILQFFRNPARIPLETNPLLVLSPADGQVVVIEKIFESEFLQQTCTQVSIFMSPLNVHVNRHPISGKILESIYHPGKFLMAWNPKSSTDNERTSILYQNDRGEKILVRQIAGFLARRVVCYAKKDMLANQGEELGFIKFGSRVDIFLPENYEIRVKIGQKVMGNVDIIANCPMTNS